MRMWHGAKASRVAGTTLSALALMVSLAACGSGTGSGDDGEKGSASKAATSAPAEETPTSESSGPTVPDTSKTLTTINGTNGFQIVIHTADRDEGGFLTVTGTIRTSSGKSEVAPVEWNGQEPQVQRTGRSLAGMTLVDKAEKKRYYVLRDTDGFPLTTTGIVAVKPGDGVAFFAQFPAPPDSTSQVDLQLPMMPTATIAIS
ncbi:hypothetical protein [Streptomyces sp. SID3212]|uniref:hypothetical protein n=1 Tax=Streptomyces sp. SID3212 TaxID=2690259 RepID=UPI0013722E1E|nr:hypothetical protein [Streptomyces sp. SID3212]MYV50944.1 hypothetical protein [Streptomyces sp. SID3212]